MDFFAQQDRARRNTRHLLGLFALAVVLIVLAVNLAAHGLIACTFSPERERDFLHRQAIQQDRAEKAREMRAKGIVMAVPPPPEAPFYLTRASKIRFHAGLCLMTLLLIGLTSWYRIARLSGSGGDRIATELGAVWVDPATTDPGQRRLVNVTEEMALAAGIPNPSLYVLWTEGGINALAAGWGFEDAAVMVSRGALENLSRDELQGVVAHEFSHILSGDMRLNIRMIGVLYGILALSVTGRAFIRGGGRNKNRGGAIGIGLVLLVIGSIGVFFARLIRAGVSRQREFSADASAVQFTRNPAGIAGALKKIATLEQGSRMGMARREEVSHMLFAPGQDFWTRIMATHPPLAERIRAIDRSFLPEDISAEAGGQARRSAGGLWRGVKGILHPSLSGGLAEEEDSRGEDLRLKTSLLSVTRNQEGTEQALSAGMTGIRPRDWTDDFAEALRRDQEKECPAASQGGVLARIPEDLLAAARSREAVEALLPALFLGGERDLRDKKMRLVWDRLGDALGRQVKTLLAQVDALPRGCIVPLADLAAPSLRALPEASRSRLLRLLDELAALDGSPSLFNYCFIRLLQQRLHDMNQPATTGTSSVRLHPARLRQALVGLFSVLAWHGHGSELRAGEAFSQGIKQLLPRTAPAYTPPADWRHALDEALAVLDGLPLGMKKKLLAALMDTAAWDGKLSPEEPELLRLFCACLRLPAPPFLA